MCVGVTSVSPAVASPETGPSASFFDLSAPGLDGEVIPFERFRGKVVLVVNTASNCGFTSQYEDLEELYREYSPRGLVVMGFPSNDFGGQEPGDNADIKRFCQTNYGVSFPMFSKAPVSGPQKQEVYQFLTERSPEEFRGDPGWNFVKFLIDKNGAVVDRFSSMTNPMGSSIRSRVEELLQNS
jgi:glutathione peroxidase